MTRDEINAFCAALPGAIATDPWGGGHDVWKVGEKSFAFMGTQGIGVTLKCADQATADMLIEVGKGFKAPYLPRGGWVLFHFDTLEPGELGERIQTSYDTVFKSLTKKLQREILAG